jgi:hypothetical protein
MTESGVWIADDTDLDMMVSAQRAALEHWRAARASSGEVPCRDAVDPPLTLPAVLPVMIMFEIDRPSGPDAPERLYRYRLIGTELVARAGRDLTGLVLNEVFGEEASKVDVEIYRELERLRCPYFGSRISMIPK